MFKLVLEKAEEPETKLSTSAGLLKKQESSRKTSTSALLTTPKSYIKKNFNTNFCKNSWQMKNRKEFSQSDEGHLLKNI